MSKRWRPAAAWRRALETFRSLGARLEAWGEREVRRRAAEARTGDASGAARKERYAVLATVAGFSISGVLALTAIALEVWLVFERPWTTEALPRFALYGAAIAAISVTELVVTMRFALWLAGRQLGRSSIHTEGGEDPLFGALARAVTGAPEPDLRPLELDCRKFVNRRARLAAKLAWLTEIGIAADDVHRARRKITSAAPLEIPVFAAAGRPGQPMRDRHTDGEAPPVTAPARIAPPTCGETARPGRSPVQRRIGHHLS